MAQTLTNIRIALRTDDEKNWASSNPILKTGELAIVKTASNNIKMKVGNGIQTFNELQYLNDELVETSLLSADEVSATSLSVRCISQGYNTKSSPTSLATGILAEAEANFGVVHGIEAKIKKGDDYAFVFNGTNFPGIAARYTSHGEGTFNINPLSGLSGFYVGEQNLSEILSTKANATGTNVWEVWKTNIDGNTLFFGGWHQGILRGYGGYPNGSSTSPIGYTGYGFGISQNADEWVLANGWQYGSGAAHPIAKTPIVDVDATLLEFTPFDNSGPFKIGETYRFEKISSTTGRVAYDYEVPQFLGQLNNDVGYITKKDSLATAEQITNTLASEIVPAIFRNVQLVKPIQLEGHRLHLHCDIARDDQFEDMVAVGIDTANGSNYQFVKYFSSDGVSGTWETMTSAGLYTDADEIPVSFYFADALSSIRETPKISSQYFMRYHWYYEMDGIDHKSDQFSIAIPSNTAVGANPGDVIHKDEFYDLKQTVQPLKQTISKDPEYNRYYVCKPTLISEIATALTGEFDVLLDDYESSQIYRFQFTVGETNATPTFYVDHGNGPEVADTLKVNIDSYVFKAGKSYYAELQGDVLKVDTLGYSEIQPGSGSGSSESVRYKLMTKTLQEGTYNSKSVLTCQIDDRATTTIVVSSSEKDVVLYLPPKPADGGARDFIIRVEVTASTAPGFYFVGASETINYDSDNEDWSVLEPGLNLISFTETK